MSALEFEAMMKAMKAAAAKKVDDATAVQDAREPTLESLKLLEDKYLVPDLPATVHYVPDALNEFDTAKLIEHLNETETWNEFKFRRVQSLGGIPHPSGMMQFQLSPILQTLSVNLLKKGYISKLPNQVLANEYSPGGGIAPHCDGPLYDECAIVFSLCGTAVMNFTSVENNSHVGSVLLEPRSILVFRGDSYTTLKHGIKASPREIIPENLGNQHLLSDPEAFPPGSIWERDLRVSLTLRHVPNVSVTLRTGEILTPTQEEERKRRESWWWQAISEDSTALHQKGVTSSFA